MADNIWTATVEGIAARGRANNGAEGDYRDEEGFLCCGKCHTRKEGDITIGEKTLRVPYLCKCESEASRQREAEEKGRRIPEAMRTTSQRRDHRSVIPVPELHPGRQPQCQNFRRVPPLCGTLAGNEGRQYRNPVFMAASGPESPSWPVA